MLSLKIHALKKGLKDGLEQAYDLTVGMTYELLDIQDFYDFGANVGQKVGRLKDKITDIWRTPPKDE